MGGIENYIVSFKPVFKLYGGKMKKFLALALGIVCAVSSTSLVYAKIVKNSDQLEDEVKVPAEAIVSTGTAILEEGSSPEITIELPTSSAVTEKEKDYKSGYEEGYTDGYDAGYAEGYEAGLHDNVPAFTNGMFTVSPANKSIKVGKTFDIMIYPVNEEEWDELSEEEWEELLEESIDSITYRSRKSSIASVSHTGVVKGKKKGITMIETTIFYSDGSENVFETKVTVKKKK